MTHRAAVAALLSLGLLAVACRSEASRSTTPLPPRAPSAATTLAGEVLASYSRSGGLAGRELRVLVRPDGAFEGGTDKVGRGQLGGSALGELRGLVAAFAGAGPRRSYGRVVPDGYMTFVEAGGASTTVLSEGDPPPPVQRLISFLAALELQLPR